MLISEAIETLNKLMSEHGDIQLCLADADTGWIFKLSQSNFEYFNDEHGGRIDLGCDYGIDEVIELT